MATFYAVVFNPTDSPVTVAGTRTVGGGEWAAVRRGPDLDRLGNIGSLVVVDAVDPATADLDDAYRAATTEAGEWNAAADKLNALGVADLRAAVTAAPAKKTSPAVPDVDTLAAWDKSDVVDLAVRSGLTPADVRRLAKTDPDQ